MNAVLEFALKLEATTCPSCGMNFAAPEHWLDERRRTHAGFYCPGGHILSFQGQSEAEKLRRELELKQAALTRAEEREASLRKQRQHLERRLHGTQGALTKVKKRVGNGVCPCCSRCFGNLQRHMASKHPDFKGEEPKE